tara:strand:+ start:538 stop:759 length:222 start_codon:yes stop_codon:yes gene_type:complete
MHCKACDKLLEDMELKRKDKLSNGGFLDLCNTCYTESNRAMADNVFDVDQLESHPETLDIEQTSWYTTIDTIE